MLLYVTFDPFPQKAYAVTQPVPESGGKLPGPQPGSGWGSEDALPLLKVDKVSVGARTSASWFSMTR